MISAFYDCDDVVAKTKKVGYKRTQLISLFLEYYKCSNEEIQFVKKFKKAEIKFGVFGGLSLVQLSFYGTPSFSAITNSEFPLVTGYSIGAYYEMIFPRLENRLSLKMNLNLFLTIHLLVQM